MASQFKVPMQTPDGKFGLKIRLPNYIYDALDELSKQGILGDTAEEVANHVLRQALFEKFSQREIAPVMNAARASRKAIPKEVFYPIPTTRPKLNKKSTQRRASKSSTRSK